MNVLLLTTSFPLTPSSSSGVFVERLAQRLGRLCHLHVLAPAAQELLLLPQDRMYRVSTFSYAPAKWRILAQSAGGIPAALSANPLLWFLVPFFIAAMLLSCCWHARRADLIFANWSICGVVASIVGRLWGRPVVTALRGADVDRLKFSPLKRIFVGLCLRWGGHVVAVSDEYASRIKELFPAMAGRVMMIPNGVDPIPVCKESSEGVKKSTVHLVIVGSLIPRKSVQTVLQALAQLPMNFILTIIGDGPEKMALVSLAKTLGVRERVHFVGHVPPEQVSDWLVKADILVMTSCSEGRPNAVLEAMAAGLPVVGSDIPGIRELVTPEVNGKIFPVGDSDALVVCLLALQDRKVRLCLGEASRRSIDERGLTWENTASLYMRLFEQLLAGKNS